MRATKLPTETLVVDPGCDACAKPCMWGGARMAKWAAEEVQGRAPYGCNSSVAQPEPKPWPIKKRLWAKSPHTLHV